MKDTSNEPNKMLGQMLHPTDKDYQKSKIIELEKVISDLTKTYTPFCKQAGFFGRLLITDSLIMSKVRFALHGCSTPKMRELGKSQSMINKLVRGVQAGNRRYLKIEEGGSSVPNLKSEHLATQMYFFRQLCLAKTWHYQSLRDLLCKIGIIKPELLLISGKKTWKQAEMVYRLEGLEFWAGIMKSIPIYTLGTQVNLTDSFYLGSQDDTQIIETPTVWKNFTKGIDNEFSIRNKKWALLGQKVPRIGWLIKRSTEEYPPGTLGDLEITTGVTVMKNKKIEARFGVTLSPETFQELISNLRRIYKGSKLAPPESPLKKEICLEFLKKGVFKKWVNNFRFADSTNGAILKWAKMGVILTEMEFKKASRLAKCTLAHPQVRNLGLHVVYRSVMGPQQKLKFDNDKKHKMCWNCSLKGKIDLSHTLFHCPFAQYAHNILSEFLMRDLGIDYDPRNIKHCLFGLTAQIGVSKQNLHFFVSAKNLILSFLRSSHEALYCPKPPGFFLEENNKKL